MLLHAHERPDPAGADEHLNTEQLRAMALNATALITAAAATEYEHYVKIRQELRRSAPSSRSSSVSGPGSAGPGPGAMRLAASGRRNHETGGAGTVAVVAGLTPVLAGGAAVLSLLVGFILKMLAPESALAQALFTTGWVFGAVAAAALLVAVFSLLRAALRSSAALLSSKETEDGLPEEVARAREAWRHALLERGILPFLRDALSDPTAYPASRTPRPAGFPKLGYSRPSFTSPEFGGPIEGTPPTGPDPSD
ncbi:hypothetical protein ACIRFF_35210 [Streptomyces cyaneofuscatus]